MKCPTMSSTCACLIWISHGLSKWVIAHMNEAYLNESWLTCMTHMNKSCHTHEWVMYHMKCNVINSNSSTFPNNVINSNSSKIRHAFCPAPLTEPNILPKEPNILPKEPSILPQEPYILPKEPYILPATRASCIYAQNDMYVCMIVPTTCVLVRVRGFIRSSAKRALHSVKRALCSA